MKISRTTPVRSYRPPLRSIEDPSGTTASRSIVPFERMERNRRLRRIAGLAFGLACLVAVSSIPSVLPGAMTAWKGSDVLSGTPDGMPPSDGIPIRRTPPEETVLGSRSSRTIATPAAPVVLARAFGGVVEVRWTPIDDPRLVGYRVSASPGDTTPEHPAQSYLFWIAEPARGSVEVTGADPNHGAGLDAPLQAGQAYWFYVTAVYDAGGSWIEVRGNPVRVEYPLPAA